MGVFEKMGETEATAGANYFQEGEYMCRVRLARHFMSQQGKGNCVVIEVTILTVFLAYQEGRRSWIDGTKLRASNVAGEVCSQVLLLDRQQPAMGNLKAFLFAASGIDERQMIAAHAKDHNLDPADPTTTQKAWEAFTMRLVSGDGKMLAGQIVKARANLIRTKAGKPHTRVLWEFPTENDHARMAEGAPPAMVPMNDPVASGAPASSADAATGAA
jgi:hypothetical protein